MGAQKLLKYFNHSDISFTTGSDGIQPDGKI